MILGFLWMEWSSEPRIGVMGYDAPRPYVPIVVCVGDCARCLNRGLRVLSEPRITLIFADGL